MRLRTVVPLLALLSAVTFVAAGCLAPSSVTFRGHGYGHGRGMGQWGAFGYAVDQGWSWNQIVDHYYGGTSASTLATNPVQRVLMQANDGRDLVVFQERGHIVTSSGSSTTGAPAVRIARVDDTRFSLYEGAGCTGPWTLRRTVTASELVVAPTVRNEDRTEMLRVCEASGQRRVRGSLIAVHANATIQTVNRIDTENMLRAVIAREMSPSWADAGSGRGFQALAAQAVAARSYMNSGDRRWAPVATTCDGGSCQAYSGVAYLPNGASTWSTYEDPRTDRAVTETAASVRRFSDGRMAATEFSASSGGWTRGPVFTEVPDAGDATGANPSHDWSVTIPTSTIEAAFDRRQGRDVGTLQSIDVTARNGNGADGGRVTSVRMRFSSVELVLTGDQMRTTLGLKSDWFTPTVS